MEYFFEAVNPQGQVIHATASEIEAVEALRGTGGIVTDANGKTIHRVDAGAVDHAVERIAAKIQAERAEAEAAHVPAQSVQPADSAEPAGSSLFDNLVQSPSPQPEPVVMVKRDPTRYEAAVAQVAGALVAPLLGKADERTAIDEAVRLAEKILERVITGATSMEPPPALKDAAGRELVQEVDDRTGAVRSFRKERVGGRTVVQRYR